MSQNIVAYSFVSEHSKQFFYVEFLSGGGGRPLVGMFFFKLLLFKLETVI